MDKDGRGRIIARQSGVTCGLSVYWAFLLTTALIQRLLQSYRPPNVVLRIALAHLISWTCIGAIVSSRPATEPTRPWVIITFFQALLIFVIVYLPWLRSYMQAAGFPQLSEKLVSHPLEDGFMGMDIGGRSASRFLVLPLVMVALCSWMLIITRGQQIGNLNIDNNGGMRPPSTGGEGFGRPQGTVSTPINQAGNNNGHADLSSERKADGRTAIFVIVLSSATPQGRINRQLFRETTLKLFPSPRNQAVQVQYRFMIGLPAPAVVPEIKREHDLTDDLLIVEAPDTADGKSMKLYKAIEWADTLDFDYLVKTEDDVLVRMDTLCSELYRQGPRSYFWKGLVFKNVPNTRLDDMDLKELPKFTDGTLTTLSRDIVRLLAQPAPRYMAASSAQSLGIWLHGYGIKPIHDIRIQPGAFVCEENLIAKHFDNEPSVLRQPHEDPRMMVDRINRIRGELKAHQHDRSFQTSLTICDNRIQKRCALCYKCTGRAANWKHMGFDCKPGGVVVGDKYRKPDLLDAKQMDELLNRPTTGISDELEIIPLRDARPEARQRQQQLQLEQDQRQLEEELKRLSLMDAAGGSNEEDDEEERDGEGSTEDSNHPSSEEEGDENSSPDNGADEGEDQEPASEEGTKLTDSQGDEEQEQDQEQNQDQDQEDAGGNDSLSLEDQESPDESEMHISDKEVDYLDRRDEGEDQPIVAKSNKSNKKSALGSKPDAQKKVAGGR
ncbi:UDP-Gal betaGal beta 1,3-galactosyltransferase, polypeptide 6 [Gryganskiella cystojenkinii]|nr:UDP-Gal betaGal beta 1,3-galactosyltransferase, polypeptide 6 [Gryganskiella cystojenkinii]